MQKRLGVPGDDDAVADLKAKSSYGQRWKAETLMSVLKRKWGESLSARQDMMQHRQGLLRGLVYNLHRLVQLGVLHWLWQHRFSWLRSLSAGAFRQSKTISNKLIFIGHSHE